MSSQTLPASYIQALEESTINIEFIYCMFALLLYDHLLTLQQEVDLVRRQKFRLSSWIYLFNYYPMIVNYLFSTVLNSYTPHCTALLQLSAYLGLVAELAGTVFQITRTYAIWSQSWLIAGILCLLYLPGCILNIWGTAVSSCENSSDSSAAFEKYQTFANITGLLFSSSVVVLTVIKTFKSSREHRRIYKARQQNLASLILQNGIMYFLLIFILIILNIVFYFHGTAYLQDIAAIISDVLGTILISRFMLDLRAKTTLLDNTDNNQLCELSTIQIAVHKTHSAIAQEFGDPLYHTSYQEKYGTDGIVLMNLKTVHRDVGGVTVDEGKLFQTSGVAAGEGEIELTRVDEI